jgi:putative glutathione S-transferase
MTLERFEVGRESSASGEFVRQDSKFRDFVTADGSSEFPAAAGRYHLYVARACPWAHRTLIVRKLKGLEAAIDVSYVHPFRDARGWAFPGGDHVDQLNGFAFLSEAYERTDPSFEGRVSVPVLWDRVNGRIVNNESADVVRMLNSEFDAFAEHADLDLYPEALRPEIDRINERVYAEVNNGVYRAGFSRSQEAYDAAFDRLFAALAWLEDLLGERRYLAGDVISEADWRLFTTLVRFDPVYYVHFRCNGRLIADHPNLWAYARELYSVPGVAETIDLAEIKTHYYTTHDELNPKRIVPKGPFSDWTTPHGRDRAFG